MSRMRVGEERLTRIAENSLFLVGEGRESLNEEAQLLMLLAGLEEAEKRLMSLDSLQEAEAYADVVEAEKDLRMARVRLQEIQDRIVERQRIHGQEQQIHDRFRALWAEEARMFRQLEPQIATDAAAVGVKHIRPELLAECSVAERETL